MITAAVATPLAAASTTDLGIFSLRGTCGILGALGPGFTLTAGAAALPARTTVIVTGSGIASDPGVG